jgi:hypothetical protein
MTKHKQESPHKMKFRLYEMLNKYFYKWKPGEKKRKVAKSWKKIESSSSDSITESIKNSITDDLRKGKND